MRNLTSNGSTHLGFKFGFHGPNQSAATACVTSTHSVGDAFRVIKYGDVDVMLAGGAYAELTPFQLAAFAKAKALSTKFNDAPQTASRPYDQDRDGFVLSQGTGLLVLEEYKNAKARGARIYSEVMGYGMSGDANHVISPREDGKGVYNAMVAALRDADQVTPENVSYVNSHATSTPLGDAAENRALIRLLGSKKQQLAVSSTKGATGHMVYGGGSVEIAFTALALHTRNLPPTINLYNLDPSGEFIFNYVANEAQQLSGNHRPVALSNSSGFGGTNACVCLRAI
jgi:3-oxoacyl-[acyl-carrier-protein] synthase II